MEFLFYFSISMATVSWLRWLAAKPQDPVMPLLWTILALVAYK